jgi:hypothetical protein
MSAPNLDVVSILAGSMPGDRFKRFHGVVLVIKDAGWRCRGCGVAVMRSGNLLVDLAGLGIYL